MDLTNDLELKGNELITLLGSAGFNAKLTALIAEKKNTVPLPPFVSRVYGWSSREVELPALHVLGLREELIKDEGTCRWQWFKYTLEVYAGGDDKEVLERITNRYARAIDEILIETYRDNGLRTNIDYSPVLRYEDNLFKACSIQFQIKVFQDLT